MTPLRPLIHIPKISVDMHCHLGVSRDGAAQTAAGIRKIFSDYPVSHAVVFPIDETSPGAGYSRLNGRIARMACRDSRIIGFSRIDPRNRQAALREVKEAKRNGMRGVKLHPRAEHFGPRDAREILAAIEKEGLPVMLHTSHEPRCRPREWQEIFLRHRKIYFILAHAGKDAFREAAAVAAHSPNVFLDTSTLSYWRTTRVLKKAGAGKIVFASDMPYSHPATELLKMALILGDRAPLYRQIFRENPKKILGGLP